MLRSRSKTHAKDFDLGTPVRGTFGDTFAVSVRNACASADTEHSRAVVSVRDFVNTNIRIRGHPTDDYTNCGWEYDLFVRHNLVRKGGRGRDAFELRFTNPRRLQAGLASDQPNRFDGVIFRSEQVAGDDDFFVTDGGTIQWED